MVFENIAILLTEDCNARCKMCCDSRGVVRGKTLSEADIYLILKNIKSVKSIRHIGITGGEPLLYSNLIDIIFKYDFGRRISFSLKTNGFWGKNQESAEKFISKYKEYLTKISLSYDEFHKEFIDIQSIKNIINISKKYNIPTEVVACCLKNTMSPGDILNELGEEAFLTNFFYQPVICTGSAKYFKPSEYIHILDTKEDDLRCIASVEQNILINPHLKVFPCCSQVIENTILEIGDLKKDSLENILSDVKHNHIFYTILTKGFTPFKTILEQKNIEYPVKIASPCEFCEFLFKNNWFLDILKEINYYEDI